MALDAVTNRWRMNLALDGGGVLVGVARNAQRLSSGGDQLYARCIFVHAYFVTAHAAHGNRGMDCLPFGLVFMAFNTLRGISFGVEWDWVYGCLGRHA